MDPWTPKFTKADWDPNHVIRFWNKINFLVICLFTATSVNNDGRTDNLRLSHLTALSTGVNNYLRCIHKGLTAFSWVTPSIRMHDQMILTRSFDPMMPAEVGSQSTREPNIMVYIYRERLSLSAFLGTEDIGVHISCVTITYTLE